MKTFTSSSLALLLGWLLGPLADNFGDYSVLAAASFAEEEDFFSSRSAKKNARSAATMCSVDNATIL
ncbi:MAG: hypothetical protein ABSA46_18295 [Thermodesulfovibrionales bacterium]|jgi:hypothetical protein